MSAFRNILAGIDLAHGPRHAPPALDEIAQEVARSARWLARQIGARLTLLSSLDLSAKELHQPIGGGRTLEEAARQLLDDLVGQAHEAGVDARGLFFPGAQHLLEQVKSGKHDLLMIGTHDPHGIQRMLFGSTAAELIHRCPCPVWVAKPRPGSDRPMQDILLASGLGTAALHGLELTLALAQDLGARVHLLHIVDYPADHIWAGDGSSPSVVAYHHRIRQEAEDAVRQQLKEAGPAPPGVDVQIHLLDKTGLPEDDLRRFLREHPADLLVLGMRGHKGIVGTLLGNAAERILPQLACPLLVVRREET
jgi:universal stress protein E